MSEFIELSELIDRDLVEIILYGGVELVFDETRQVTLKVESDFTLKVDGQTQLVHLAPAYDDPACGLDVLASLLRKTVIAAVAKVDGSLILDFSTGTRLHVSHDDKYEAWILTRSSGESLISLPGGGLG